MRAGQRLGGLRDRTSATIMRLLLTGSVCVLLSVKRKLSREPMLIRIHSSEVPPLDRILKVGCFSYSSVEFRRASLQGNDANVSPTICKTPSLHDARWILSSNRLANHSDCLSAINDANSVTVEDAEVSVIDVDWGALDRIANDGDAVVEVPKAGRIALYRLQ